MAAEKVVAAEKVADAEKVIARAQVPDVPLVSGTIG
jgi:hypothetical protein